MSTPARTRRGAYLCALFLPLHIPAQETAPAAPASDTVATEEAYVLSPEEARALGLDSAAQVAERSGPILDIEIRGVDPLAHPFLLHLLPVRTGQILSRSELDERLAAFNRRIRGRTDLFEACVAMAQPRADGWRILVEARSRTFGSYGGGNAYGYLGNHNRTGRGDRWGAWLGPNQLGLQADAVLAPGTNLGASAVLESPAETSAPDRGLRHLRLAATTRHFASPTLSFEAQAGVWLVQARASRLPGPMPTVLFLRPAMESDQSWAREEAGIGAVLRGEATLGQDLSNSRPFAGLTLHAQARSLTFRRMSLVALGEAGLVLERPAFHPALSGAFGSWRAQASDPALDRTITAVLQPRLSLWNRPLWFTGLDLGILGHLEAYRCHGAWLHEGIVHGAGLHLGFRPPVGVDFLLVTAWEGPRFLGTRFTTLHEF